MTTTTAPAPAATKRKPRTSVPTPEVTPASVDVMTAPTAVVVQVPVDLLDDHPLNPRRDVGDLAELADSIRVHGIRQNLLITPNHGVVGRYWLVIGHRRAAAARLCGLDTVPAAVDNTLTEAAALELMLLENLQRTDLTPVEEADGYQGLLDLGLDVTRIANHTGRSRKTVESRLQLVGLPEAARTAVHEHRATLEDAAKLEQFKDDPKIQADLAEQLGRKDFDYLISDARRKRREEVALKPLVDALTAAGATHYDGVVPRGMVRVCYAGGNDTAGIARALASLADATPEWTWTDQYSYLYVYRPSADAQPDQDATEEDDAEYQASLEQANARRDALTALAETSSETRKEFLEHLIRDRKLTQSETLAIVTFTGFELFQTAYRDDSTDIVFDYDEALTWLHIDADAIRATAQEPDADETEAIDQAFTTALNALDPANRLLTALAAANEPLSTWAWNAPVSRHVKAWYALLGDLGYTPAGPEQAALDADQEAGS